VFERLHRACRGVRGGAGGKSPPRRGSGAAPPNFFFVPGRHISGTIYYRDDIFPGRHISGTTYFQDHMIFRWFFGTWFLPMVFYFRLRN
jgi:hypothetical protein